MEEEFEIETKKVSDTGTLSGFVKERYTKASDAKFSDEQRAIRAYRNYRGIYGPDVQFTDSEVSKVFIKITKAKTLAAYGQVAEVLLGSSKFPLTIEPTTIPIGIEEAVHIETNDQLKSLTQGRPAQDERLQPGETFQDYMERIGPIENDIAGVEDEVKQGEGKTSSQVTFHPAMKAARKMEKKIHDQLEESAARKHLRSTAFELVLFGTGIMKGPFSTRKEYPNWNEDGVYDPIFRVVPEVTHVSFWNFYPDPDAFCMEDAQYVVERHKMSRSALRQLKKRPYFDEDAIDLAIEYGENYRKEWWEQVMEDDNTDTQSERYEVLEFWGNVDTKVLENYGVELDSEYSDMDQVSMNVWLCNDQIIRVVINPFTPEIIPYHVCPYETNPYSMFGVGIAENMDDTQTLMNGFMRMAVDNAALSGNLVFEVSEEYLTPGQDMKIYPGKMFRRQEGAPGQALFSHQFQNVSAQNMQMFDVARRLADESTGMPSFAHGQTGVQGVGRTASGISMLMGAANGSIRTVVKNVDDYLLAPLGRALFAFNMENDFDPEIRGDLEVKARGTESLMANEVRSQRLMQFLGIVQNPALAPFAKMDYIIKEIAKSLDLDPDKVVNSLQAAAVQAELLKQFQAEQPQPQGAPLPPGTNPQDPTGAGGGTMGTGQAPAPGTPGFAGNTGGMNEQAPEEAPQ